MFFAVKTITVIRVYGKGRYDEVYGVYCDPSDGVSKVVKFSGENEFVIADTLRKVGIDALIGSSLSRTDFSKSYVHEGF